MLNAIKCVDHYIFFDVPELSQCGDRHIVPQHSRQVLQLLDPVLPLPQGDMGEGEEGFPCRFPLAPSVTAAEHSEHAMRPHRSTQQGWSLKTTRARIKPAAGLTRRHQQEMLRARTLWSAS